MTSPDSRTIAIVGASLAGGKAADTLREEGFTGRVVLIGDEDVRPYERPPLSKDYLRGDAGPDQVFLHDEGYYAEHDIELRRSTRAVAIDPGAQEVRLDDSETVRYDSLLLATGAAPRALTVPGAQLDGVHYLRTIKDSDRLRSAIASGGRVAVIGAGWIGCEVAASARQMGAEVSMVEVAALPLERVLGPELGRFYRDVHADHGVDMHFGVGLGELRGSGRVEEVVLTDGQVLAADLVVAGIGVVPRVELAEAAGLMLDNGVLVDEYLLASAPNVFAAGDVANAWHPILDRRIRLEHWSSALNQGPAAARNMLGAHIPYERIPYFFSDQYDVGMEYSGSATEWDQVVFRGSVAQREFIAFWLEEGRVTAGMNVNVWDVADTIARLVAAKATVDPLALADPEVELGHLLG
jgi:3-phenylpropionate/trans-cinnamate dioxygenase ferredoxin reductase component